LILPGNDGSNGLNEVFTLLIPRLFPDSNDMQIETREAVEKTSRSLGKALMIGNDL
jgi:hypothetical protein